MIFTPTGTSKILINSVKPFIREGSLLDLGCGCGVVGESLKTLADVYASDISEEAVSRVRETGITARCGNLFEPWQGWKFDYIVDDVSGIAEDIARVSPWFNGVPCASGKDGADLVCEVIRQAPQYLKLKGKLFFPIVSLSNAQRIKSVALNIFENLELIGHQDFPLPKELQDFPIPQEYIKDKFGIKIFWTDIYMVVL